MSSYRVGIIARGLVKGVSVYTMWLSAAIGAVAAQASSAVPNAAASRLARARLDDQTERQPFGGDELGAGVDDRPYGCGVGDADDPFDADQRADPVRQVDDLVRRAAGDEARLPPEMPTTSCGNTGPVTIETSLSTIRRLISTSTAWRIAPLQARRSAP